MTDIRQQIKKAEALIASGDLKRARTLLQTVDHHKARAMLVDVEAQLGDVSPASQWTRIKVMASAFVMFFILGSILVAVLVRDTEGEALVEALPTLAVIPTSDCTPETVRTWWGVQNVALDTFTQDASSASRTMPGERLNERLASLRQFRADFPDPPECASSEFRTAINDLLRAMDDTITALEGWSDGTMDGLAVTIALQEAESALRAVRTRVKN